MNDFDFVEEELDRLKQENLKREFKTVITASGPWVELSTGKRVLQFASNSYLGLANHPEIINACKTANNKYGIGSTGSRLLSGTTELHLNLEKELAKFESTEDAIFFSSGYLANIGVISSLIQKEDAVFSDELNHASIIDGIKLSGATKFIYKHNNVKNLEFLLEENLKKFRRLFIITDSIFSMDGDIAPLREIALLAEKYNCYTILDEAHATGVFGEKGSGLIEEFSLYNSFPVRIGTCSKALGIEGGFCVGPKSVMDFLRNKARSFIFSTSSSPGIVSALIKSVELVKESSWRREKLWKTAKLLHSNLSKNYKLKLNEFKTPIVCIYFKEINEAVEISNRLFDECHIWAPVIRPPSVKQPRIRLTPIATHSEEDIDFVVKAFEYISKDLKVAAHLGSK